MKCNLRYNKPVDAVCRMIAYSAGLPSRCLGHDPARVRGSMINDPCQCNDALATLAMMLCSYPQVYEFQDAHSGMLCVAQPPQGVSAASLVASALSWALGSPLRLPLEPLLTCNPDSLPRLQQTLVWRPAMEQSKLALFLCKLPGT